MQNQEISKNSRDRSVIYVLLLFFFCSQPQCIFLTFQEFISCLEVERCFSVIETPLLDLEWPCCRLIYRRDSNEL